MRACVDRRAVVLARAPTRLGRHHIPNIRRASMPGRRCARSARTRRVVTRAVSVNDFKTGLTIEMDNAPWRVIEFLHVKPGKGAAFVRSKLKNLMTGNTLDKTFRAGEKVDAANLERSIKQFTYMDGEQYVFMDMTSYEETRLDRDDSWANFLKEGMEANVLEWRGKVIGVELPRQISLEVTDTEPGVKGDTKKGGGSKSATLETGATVLVPLFIQSGEKINIDTVTGEYMSRDTA